MNLSKRLMTAVNMVTEGFAVLDVGCDHAYTSIELVRKKSPCAVASDVRPGPLKAARDHIAEAGLEDKITTVLADGVPRNILSLLPENLPSTLVITGMGGMLIIKILSEAGGLIERFDELVLSPQSDIYAVRKYLLEQGYAFIDEAEILEDGKFYTLMKVRRNPEIVSMRDGLPGDAELTYGPYLLRKKDKTLKAYLTKRRNVLTDIKKRLIESGRSTDDARVREIDEELRIIDEAERYY